MKNTTVKTNYLTKILNKFKLKYNSFDYFYKFKMSFFATFLALFKGQIKAHTGQYGEDVIIKKLFESKKKNVSEDIQNNKSSLTIITMTTSFQNYRKSIMRGQIFWR